MADASVIVSTELDNKKLEKDLSDLTKKIEKSEESIRRMQEKQAQDKELSLFKSGELDAEKAKLQEIKDRLQDVRSLAKDKSLPPVDRTGYADQIPAVRQELADQQTLVRGLQAEYNTVTSRAERYDQKIADATEELERQKEKAGELTQKIEEASAGSSRMGDAVKTASAHMDKFVDRVKRLAGRVFVFSMITRAFRELIGWLWKVIQTDAEASRAFGQLKGALLTLAQPLVNIIIPAFTFLVNLLAQVITAISKLFAKLFGYSYSDTKKQAQALSKEAAAIGGVGDAAKEASKYLAGFDELNTLPTEDKGSSGGGAGGLGDLTAPNFEDPGVTDYLDNILYLIGAIGAGLLAWRIARAFTDDLALAAGIGLAVGGALLFAFNWADAFANGIDWLNLGGMLAGLIVLAGGLFLAFGPVGAAIGLLVGGISLLVLGIREWITTGELSNAACAAIVAGIVAIGGAIALFTGSWIPLAIGAVVGFIFACVTKGEEIKAALQKLDDWLQGVFTKDWTEVFGPVIGGVLNGFFDKFRVIWDSIKQMLGGLVDFIQGTFTGNWAQAWEGLKNIAKGAVNGVIGVINSMIASVINGINALFQLLSFNINLPGGGSFGLNLPQYTPPQIPYLAKGAVIPPNREFMAVLGDQAHGNNIEAPEDLIRKIVREETAGRGDDQLAALLEELIAVVGNIRVGDDVIGRAAQRYNRNSQRARGW